MQQFFDQIRHVILGEALYAQVCHCSKNNDANDLNTILNMLKRFNDLWSLACLDTFNKRIEVKFVQLKGDTIKQF